jgi:hypothetical protein
VQSFVALPGSPSAPALRRRRHRRLAKFMKSKNQFLSQFSTDRGVRFGGRKHSAGGYSIYHLKHTAARSYHLAETHTSKTIMCIRAALLAAVAAFAGPATAAPLAPSAAAAPVVTPLFVPTARHPCFRQPAILSAGDTILAFAENRNVSACAPELESTRPGEPEPGGLSAPMEVGSMLLRRSTDGGETWLPMQSLLAGNIDFYTVAYDAKSHTVWLMVASKGTAVLSSKDSGATWETMPHLDPETLSRPPIHVSGPAVGHGIQVRAHVPLLPKALAAGARDPLHACGSCQLLGGLTSVAATPTPPRIARRSTRRCARAALARTPVRTRSPFPQLPCGKHQRFTKTCSAEKTQGKLTKPDRFRMQGGSCFRSSAQTPPQTAPTEVRNAPPFYSPCLKNENTFCLSVCSMKKIICQDKLGTGVGKG